MTEQKTVRKISSFAAPTEDDLAYFESLPPREQRALLRAELDKGFGSLSDQTLDETVSKTRARAASRRAS